MGKCASFHERRRATTNIVKPLRTQTCLHKRRRAFREYKQVSTNLGEPLKNLD